MDSTEPPEDGRIGPRPDSTRFAVHCICGETWYPHKGGDYSNRYSDGPRCPSCGEDWRNLEGADEFVDENGNPDWSRDDWKPNTLPNGVHQGNPDDYDYPEDY